MFGLEDELYEQITVLEKENKRLLTELSNSEFTLDQVLEANKVFAEVNKRLQDAVDWAIANVDNYVTVHEEVGEEWEIEFRRRIKEGK